MPMGGLAQLCVKTLESGEGALLFQLHEMFLFQ